MNSIAYRAELLFREWCIVGLLCALCCLRASGQIVYRGMHTNKLLGTVHETIPIKVSAAGEYLSHNVTTYHDANASVLHVNVTIHEKKHLLSLRPVQHFFTPNIIVERRRRDSYIRYKPTHKSRQCHFQGIIHGQSNSRVALSACNGLTGLLLTQDGKFFIEPAYRSPSKEVQNGHVHLVYKRSAVASSHSSTKKKKKRRRHSKECGTKEPKKLVKLKWQKQVGKIQIQEKKSHYKHKYERSSLELELNPFSFLKRGRRSISKPQYVEALLVADHRMVEFHQNGDLETYLLTIMNMVSCLYMDPSIGNSVNVVVVKIVLLDDPQSKPELNVTVNADQTLRNFCKWQKALNPADDTHPHHHDVAILITRNDICSRQNTLCNTLGVAHIAGMCKSSRSCSVNEDNGITLAHTIAHEMGHNFGMSHDTEKIGCKSRQGNISHIMTPSFEADTMEVRWSRCSRREITNFLDKGLGQCLQDKPEDLVEYEYPELPPGAMYNADYQCRLQFGVDATVCSPMDEICARLWCNVNDTCITQLRPAAAGTHCGKHKWCQNQKCVLIMDTPTSVDGGWSEWSSWSECSRSCGAGVSMMQRECDHPTPAAGGRFCVGERRRYRICNTDACPDNVPTFRAQQCTQFNNHSYEGLYYEWQPYFSKDEPCKLFCSDVNETVIVPWAEYVADGTPCNVGSRDVCITGICRNVGCDWIVNSDAKEDECGVCQGDGSKCDKIEGVYTKQSDSQGYKEVVIIPSGAANIQIEETDSSPNYIGVGSALTRKFYLNGKRHITLPGEYSVAGVQAMYERDNQLEKIRIPGPVREPIAVYLIFMGETANPGIRYKYTVAKPPTTKQLKYSWAMGDWSECSATCGGGSQKREFFCQESIVAVMPTVKDGTSRFVDETMCEERRPDTLYRSCNDEPCPTHWWIGPWQSCPATCINNRDEVPMKRRSVMCVDGAEMALLDRFCDKNVKPLEYKRCHALPSCNEESDNIDF